MKEKASCCMRGFFGGGGTLGGGVGGGLAERLSVSPARLEDGC